MNEVPGFRYDAVELGRRMVVCFTVSELRALAESMGLAESVDWSAGLHTASRQFVRQCEQYSGLPVLVAKLRELRPLFEWQEPDSPSPAQGEGTVPDPPPAEAPIVVAPGAMPAAVPAGAQSSVSPLSAGGGAVDSAAPRHVAFSEGNSVPEAPRSAAGIDPRVLIGVAAIMLAAAVVAFIAGRASSIPTASEGPSPEATGSSPGREPGPALLARSVLERSEQNLLRLCDLPPDAPTAGVLFLRVIERCSRPPVILPRPSPVVPTPGDPARRADDRDDPRAGGDPRGVPATRLPKGGGLPASGPAGSCLSSCEVTRRSCDARCGPEPTQAGSYDAFNRCRARCLSAASRCRLGCP